MKAKLVKRQYPEICENNLEALDWDEMKLKALVEAVLSSRPTPEPVPARGVLGAY